MGVIFSYVITYQLIYLGEAPYGVPSPSRPAHTLSCTGQTRAKTIRLPGQHANEAQLTREQNPNCPVCGKAFAAIEAQRSLVELESYRLIMSNHKRDEGEFISRKFDAVELPCAVVEFVGASKDGVRARGHSTMQLCATCLLS